MLSFSLVFSCGSCYGGSKALSNQRLCGILGGSKRFNQPQAYNNMPYYYVLHTFVATSIIGKTSIHHLSYSLGAIIDKIIQLII